MCFNTYFNFCRLGVWAFFNIFTFCTSICLFASSLLCVKLPFVVWASKYFFYISYILRLFSFLYFFAFLLPFVKLPFSFFAFCVFALNYLLAFFFFASLHLCLKLPFASNTLFHQVPQFLHPCFKFCNITRLHQYIKLLCL